MRKKLSKLLVSVLTTAIVMTSMPVDMLTVQAEEPAISVSGNDAVVTEEVELPVYEEISESELSGTFGPNKGFSWTYDESTATLTVTGEDSSYQTMDSYLPLAIKTDMRHIVFRDFTISGYMSYFLSDFGELESVVFENVDTTNVTNMESMFYLCRKLKTLDLSSFDTSNVTNMRNMFAGCNNLESVDLSSFDTTNVTDMEYMFHCCNSLTSVDLSSFDTSNVTDMGSMFGGCSVLESLDLSNFNTSNVMDMSYMFDVCSGLTNLNVSSFDTGNVKFMKSMFYMCINVENLAVSGFDTGNVTNMESMFAYCKGVQALDLSGFDTTNVTNMSGMFSYCTLLSNLDLSGFDTTNATNISSMLTGCSSLTTITTPKTMGEGQSIELPYYFYNPENVEASAITSAFCNQVLLKDKLAPLAGNFGDKGGFHWSYDDDTTTLIVTGEDSGLNALISQLPESVMKNMQYIIFRDCAASGSLEGLLLNLYNVKSLTFENFDTGNVTSMKGMFEGCRYLTSMNISGFDIGNVTDMSRMFYDCIRLQSVDLGGLDISKVTDMSYIFYNCGSLESVDLSDLDTGNVTNMSSMFYGCSKLKSLDVSGFATGNVTDMSNMFYGCSSVKELDVTNFATGNVTTLAGMFYNCCSLKIIDLSSFDTGKVTDMSTLFYNCTKLTTITTPKIMAEGQIIELPYVFYDPKNDVVTSITKACCNQILTKDKLTGTFGTNGGFNWSYDDINEILTITGQDSGLPDVKNYVPDGTKKVIFEECIISGGMGNLLQDKAQIESVEFVDCELGEVTSFNFMFDGCSNLKYVDISGLDSSNIVYMQGVFYDCSSLESVDLSSWNTGNVQYMSYMFRNCGSLKSLDVSGFDTSKVIKMNEMFYGCSSLESLDVSSFNTGKVTTMTSMFSNCTGLESLDVSGFDTSKVTNMDYMFSSCTSLKSVDITGFDTTNVTGMNAVFSNCPGLESVDFSSFDTSKVTNLGSMFYNGRNLKTIVTPNTMTEEQSIELPYVFYDSQGQSIELITSEHCNKLLVKDNVDYTITYHLDGGTNAVENPASYTTFSDTIILREPTWEGYVFEGWYADEAYSSEQTQINAHSWGNVDLYAKWLPNKYTVRFDGNGGEGSMEDLANLNYGTSYTLTASTYERAGYTFVGWNTAADGRGESYADNASIESLTAEDGATVILYAQWTIKKYSVVFDKNATDAIGEMEDISNVTYGEEVTLPANTYTNTGYTFAGWNTVADGSGDSYADTASVENLSTEDGATVTLYAQWMVNEYAIAFNKNVADATGEMANITNVEYGETVTLLSNAYTYIGYTFTGWNSAADGSGESYADNASVKNLSAEDGATVTLYAQWMVNEYAIAFNKNVADATGEMANITNVEYDETVTLPSNAYTYIGYTFTGWNSAADGSGESYADNASVKNLTAEDGATVTLYAQWTVNKYSVVFDKNAADATGEMAGLTNVEYSESVTLPANAYAYTGHTFAGWNTAADGSGVSYADNASLEKLTAEDGATVMLYAQWVVNKYSVVFDKNAVDASGEMERLAGVEYGETVTLPVNTYEYIGCTFAGWNTAADGSGVFYADNASVESLTSEDGATVTLYAQWTAKKYSVVFDKNAIDAIGEMAGLTNIEHNETVILPANAYEYIGYIFTGWNTAADGSGDSYEDEASVENLTTEDGATVTLYAQWTAKKYTVVFDKNGGSGTMAGMTDCVYGTDYKLTANKFKRTGYTFKGWTLNKKGTGTLYKNASSVKNLTAIDGQTITLYAQWTANKYTIKFKKNGTKVKGTMKSMKNREYGKSYKLTKNKFKRKGYTFKGWTLKKNGKGKVYKNRAKVKNLTATNGATVTLYAKWKANKYTIKFNKNAKDATGKMKSMTNRKYGKTYKLTKNAFERKGYTFKGWNTKKNGKGKSYKNGAKVKNLVAKNKGTITLYAQWK